MSEEEPWEETKKLKHGIHEIDTWLCNELEDTAGKIQFYVKNNDALNFSKHAGKLEMAANVLEKLRAVSRGK